MADVHRAARRRSRTRRCGWSTAGTGPRPTSPGCARWSPRWSSRLSGDKQPGAFTDAVGSRLTGVQAGTVLAYLSGRVLGQYEVFSADPGQLLLVAPNIVEVERKLGADPRDFRLWVCLHEVTHRTQFTAVPWMRGPLPRRGAGVRRRLAGRRRARSSSGCAAGSATLSDAVRDPDSRASRARHRADARRSGPCWTGSPR